MSFVDWKISKHVWDLIFLHNFIRNVFSYADFQRSQKRHCYQLHWRHAFPGIFWSRSINSLVGFYRGPQYNPPARLLNITYTYVRHLMIIKKRNTPGSEPFIGHTEFYTKRLLDAVAFSTPVLTQLSSRLRAVKHRRTLGSCWIVWFCTANLSLVPRVFLFSNMAVGRKPWRFRKVACCHNIC